MKKNKLTISAFEKYELTDKIKILVTGGYPEGWTPPLLEDDYSGDPITDGGDDPDNATGGPGSSTSTATGTIKLVDVIIEPVRIP